MPTLDLSRRLGAANRLQNDLVGVRRCRAGSGDLLPLVQILLGLQGFER
jgi:hypothetical protein